MGDFSHRLFYMPKLPVKGSLKIDILGVKNVKVIKRMAIKQRMEKAILGYLQVLLCLNSLVS